MSVNRARKREIEEQRGGEEVRWCAFICSFHLIIVDERSATNRLNRINIHCVWGTECAARLMLSATLIRIHHFVWCYRFIAKWLNYNPFSSQCLFALRHDETNGTQKTHIPFLLVRSQSSHTANATSNGKHGPMSMWKHAIAAVICFTSTHLLDEYFFLVWFAWKCKTTLLTRLQHSAPAITISFHVDQHIHIPNWCIHKIYAIKSTSFCLRIHRIYGFVLFERDPHTFEAFQLLVCIKWKNWLAFQLNHMTFHKIKSSLHHSNDKFFSFATILLVFCLIRETKLTRYSWIDDLIIELFAIMNMFSLCFW